MASPVSAVRTTVPYLRLLPGGAETRRSVTRIDHLRLVAEAQPDARVDRSAPAPAALPKRRLDGLWSVVRLPRLGAFAERLSPRLRTDLALDAIGRRDVELDRARHLFALSGLPPPRL